MIFLFTYTQKTKFKIFFSYKNINYNSRNLLSAMTNTFYNILCNNKIHNYKQN